MDSYAGHVQAPGERPYSFSTEMKARQSSKIRELADAVEAAGFLTLDEQAQVLGVPRSTAWTIRRASHKASGLSAKILEYVEEKAAGLYGGNQRQRRRFTTRLSLEKLPEILGI